MAISISVAKGERLSPAAVAEIHTMLQPEIEKRGYVMASRSRSADYFVLVRYPFDPLGISRLTFVRAEPTVPFLRENDTQGEQQYSAYKRAIADMITEPK